MADRLSTSLHINVIALCGIYEKSPDTNGVDKKFQQRLWSTYGQTVNRPKGPWSSKVLFIFKKYV